MKSSPEPVIARPRKLKVRQMLLLLLHGAGSVLLASLTTPMYFGTQLYLFGYAGCFAVASALAAVALWKDDILRWRVAVALYWLAPFLVNGALAVLSPLGG